MENINYCHRYRIYLQGKEDWNMSFISAWLPCSGCNEKHDVKLCHVVMFNIHTVNQMEWRGKIYNAMKPFLSSNKYNNRRAWSDGQWLFRFWELCTIRYVEHEHKMLPEVGGRTSSVIILCETFTCFYISYIFIYASMQESNSHRRQHINNTISEVCISVVIQSKSSPNTPVHFTVRC